MTLDTKEEIAKCIAVTCDLSSKKWLSGEEAAVYTTFSVRTLKTARDMNKLAYHTLDRKIVFKRTELDLWLDSLEFHIEGRIKNKNKRKTN